LLQTIIKKYLPQKKMHLLAEYFYWKITVSLLYTRNTLFDYTHVCIAQFICFLTTVLAPTRPAPTPFNLNACFSDTFLHICKKVVTFSPNMCIVIYKCSLSTNVPLEITKFGLKIIDYQLVSMSEHITFKLIYFLRMRKTNKENAIIIAI
jgi:hypothetical protein